MIKRDSKYICYKNTDFLFIKESWKKYLSFHKYIKQHGCFCLFWFSILEWFQKDHVTQDWNNDSEYSAYSAQVLKYVKIEISYFEL